MRPVRLTSNSSMTCQSAKPQKNTPWQVVSHHKVDLLGFFRRCTQSGEASSETSWTSSCLWKHIIWNDQHIHLKTDSKPLPRTSSSRERLPSLSRSKVLKAWKVAHEQVAPNATNTPFNRTSLMRFNWPASICVATKRAWNAWRGAFTENKQGGLVKHYRLCSWKRKNCGSFLNPATSHVDTCCD